MIILNEAELMPSRDEQYHSSKFRVLARHSKVCKFNFFPRTILDWNALPSIVLDCNKLDSFKTGLNSYTTKCGFYNHVFFQLL